MAVNRVGTKADVVPDGWTWTVKQRTKGKTAGKFDCYIYK